MSRQKGNNAVAETAFFLFFVAPLGFGFLGAIEEEARNNARQQLLRQTRPSQRVQDRVTSPGKYDLQMKVSVDAGESISYIVQDLRSRLPLKADQITNEVVYEALQGQEGVGPTIDDIQPGEYLISLKTIDGLIQ